MLIKFFLQDLRDFLEENAMISVKVVKISRQIFAYAIHVWKLWTNVGQSSNSVTSTFCIMQHLAGVSHHKILSVCSQALKILYCKSLNICFKSKDS